MVVSYVPFNFLQSNVVVTFLGKALDHNKGGCAVAVEVRQNDGGLEISVSYIKPLCNGIEDANLKPDLPDFQQAPFFFQKTKQMRGYATFTIGF